MASNAVHAYNIVHHPSSHSMRVCDWATERWRTHIKSYFVQLNRWHYISGEERYVKVRWLYILCMYYSTCSSYPPRLFVWLYFNCPHTDRPPLLYWLKCWNEHALSVRQADRQAGKQHPTRNQLTVVFMHLEGVGLALLEAATLREWVLQWAFN